MSSLPSGFPPANGPSGMPPLGIPAKLKLRRDEQPEQRGAEGAGAKLLSGVGGSFQLSPDLRSKCALLADGQFLVHEACLNNATVLSARERAIRKFPTLTVSEPVAVPGSKIRELVGDDIIGKDPGGTEIRQRLIRVIERGAAVGASDVQIRHYDEGHAIVQYQVDGYLTDVRDDFDPKDAPKLFTSAFYYSDYGHAVEQPDLPSQIASITKKSKLGEHLGGIRMQFSRKADHRHLNLRLHRAKLPVSGVGLEPLGLPPRMAANVRRIQRRSHGLFSVVAPTEHGKSTTLNIILIDLYEAMLAEGRRILISGADDPPETKDPRLAIMEIRHDLPGNPYQEVLDTLLREAPHNIKIGECRKDYAANAAFEIAEFGKLVSTTMHTDEALMTPNRYLRLKVPIEAVLRSRTHIGWMSQRLVPTLCPTCSRLASEAAQEDIRAAEIYADFAALDPALRAKARLPGTGRLRNGDPCPTCTREDGLSIPGIKGRMLVPELIIPDDELIEAAVHDLERARKIWLSRPDERSMRLWAYDALVEGRIGLTDYSRFLDDAAQLEGDLALAGEKTSHGKASFAMPRTAGTAATGALATGFAGAAP